MSRGLPVFDSVCLFNGEIVTKEEYASVVAIVNKAVYNVTAFELEEIQQEAAIAAFKFGLNPSTRVFWAARDAYRGLRSGRKTVKGIVVPVENLDGISPIDTEETAMQALIITEMMACLSPTDKFIVQAIDLDGWSQQEVADYLHLNNSTVSRRRTAALASMRQ